MEGIILVNKPTGMTSHDVVDYARDKLKIRKIGHAGTLDPLAEGLLILLVGKATKLFPKFSGFDKEYFSTFKLGETTTTGDSQGTLLETKDFSSISLENIKQACFSFKGEIEQVPPMVSAIRVKGKRLYELARKGIEVERSARKIIIHDIRVENIEMPYVHFYVHCSKGTYIRKLAENIGARLSCGAHITMIRRLGIGDFKLTDAVELEGINENCLRRLAA